MFLKCKDGLINLDYVKWINFPCLNKVDQWVVWAECDDSELLTGGRSLIFDSEQEAWDFIEQALEKKGS